MEQKKIIVGATGASGLPLLLECLKLIRAAEGFSSALMMTHGAELTLKHEMAMERADVAELADEIFAIDEIGAGPASGSYRAVGMLVVPCSMKTLAGIYCGYADNLLLRSADVMLKEKRPLAFADGSYCAAHAGVLQQAEVSRRDDAADRCKAARPLRTYG